MAVKTIKKTKTEEELKIPSSYYVIFHNDDYTTMEFVIDVLVNIFNKALPEAESLMIKVHNKGKAIVGKYSYDVALTKVNQTIKIARNEGHPLRVTMEKED